MTMNTITSNGHTTREIDVNRFSYLPSDFSINLTRPDAV